MRCALLITIAAVASGDVLTAKCGPEAIVVDGACVAVGSETADDHEDTALLQTKAVSHTVTKHAKHKRSKRSIHRFSIDEQDDVLSLLQGGHKSDSQVYQLCAQDSTGLSDDSEDLFHATTESCGNLTVTNEAGESLPTVYGCIPASIAEGDCLALVESADFFSQHADQNNQLVKVPLQEDSAEASDVFLIEIPTMDEISFLKAMKSIQEQIVLVPGAVVLFQGKGALQASKHRGGFFCGGFCVGMLGFGMITFIRFGVR